MRLLCVVASCKTVLDNNFIFLANKPFYPPLANMRSELARSHADAVVSHSVAMCNVVVPDACA